VGATDGTHGSRVASGDSMAGLVDLAVQPSLQTALRAVREMLGMEVSYTSQIVGDGMVLREFDGDAESFHVAKGLRLPSEQTYCQRMLDGRIPNLIPDVRAEERLASLPITQAGNVGAFATVPLTFADGSVYGTLCAGSHDAKPLGYRELQFLKVFARMIADHLERESAAVAFRELAALVNASDDAIVGTTPTGVVRSWNLASERMFGYPAAEAIGTSVVDLLAPLGRGRGCASYSAWWPPGRWSAIRAAGGGQTARSSIHR
jgi:PAS domain-containing protein